MWIFLLICVLVTAAICIAESCFEKDWPRDTFKFFAAFVVIFCAWIVLIGPQ